MRMAGRMLRFRYLMDAGRAIILKLGSTVSELMMRMPMSNRVRRYEEYSGETEYCRDTQHGSGHLNKLCPRLHGGNPNERFGEYRCAVFPPKVPIGADISVKTGAAPADCRSSRTSPIVYAA